MTPQQIKTLEEKFGKAIDSAAHIWTWTGRNEMLFLADQASRANFAIEQGVYMGASAFVQLAANPHLHLWCVDPFMVAGTEMVTRNHLKEFIAQGRCEIIPKYTPDAAAQLQHMRGKIDFCFIDGAHDKVNVMQDIDAWLPLLRSGALLSGHDYEPPNEVAQAVQSKLFGHFVPTANMFAYIKP